MSTSSTLRNMAFIFTIMHKDFEKGTVEKDFIDIWAVINEKKYIMEAKSAYQIGPIKKINNSKLGTAAAQIIFRGKPEDFGVIVTNMRYDRADETEADELSFVELDKGEIEDFHKVSGFEKKLKTLFKKELKKLPSDFERELKFKRELKKRLQKYFILCIKGRNDEEIRKKIKDHLAFRLIQNGEKFDLNSVHILVDTSDQILESISENKNTYDKETFVNWFKIRKNGPHSSLKYDALAKEVFDDENEFIEAQNSANLRSSLDLSEKDFQNILTCQDSRKINEYTQSILDEAQSDDEKLKGYINHIKINWLLLKESEK